MTGVGGKDDDETDVHFFTPVVLRSILEGLPVRLVRGRYPSSDLT